MSNTLSYLQNKANQLHIKLQALGISVSKKHKLHILAKVLGFKCWDALYNNYHRNPVPHTCYRLNAERLSLVTAISLNDAIKIIDEIRWQNEYVPIFNRLPLQEDGIVAFPRVLINSNIFSCSRKRGKFLRKRISFFDSEFNTHKDYILFSGEELNSYDKIIFLSITYLHPVENAVGREFSINLKELFLINGRKYSVSSFENSIKRMTDCRIEILPINFFGPLISTYKRVKIKSENVYKITLNPELVKLYRDPMYGQFMDSANLFHYDPTIDNYSINLPNSIKKSNYSKNSNSSSEIWPTYEDDIAAILSIIAKDASGGSAQFKLIEDVQFDDDNEGVKIKFPDWYKISLDHFIDLYGNEYGSIIFIKAIKHFLKPMFHIS